MHQIIPIHMRTHNITFNPMVILLITLQLFLFSCKQPGPKQEIVEAKFNVDQSLLSSDPLTDAGLSFSMQYPADWEFLANDFRTLLADQILVGKYSSARIVSGCVDPVDSSMLIMLDVSKVDSSFFSDLKQNYESVFNQENGWINAQLETFTHDCFIVDQYVLQNERLVQFRLQCRDRESTSRHPRMEIYFFLNRLRLDENIKSIESSIGTLKCLN